MGKYRYGVMLDAGSSGTRVHVYRWYKTAVARALASTEELHGLPIIKTRNKKWTMKVNPGISTFGDKTNLVGPEHLKDLLEFALDIVPKSEVADTPIFLMATAGMRLLDDLPRRVLLDEICKYAKANTGFYISNCDDHIQVISGETEGLYGWIAANYLVGGFNQAENHAHGDDHHTYGFLDMGGASAQIAFAPNSTETEKHGNDLQLLRMRTIDGAPAEYKVFVTTFLGYGANEARRRYIQHLEESHEPSETHKALPDPCLPVGLRLTKEGRIIKPGSQESEGNEAFLLGTGQFSECIASTYNLLDKEASCSDPPCLFHGVHVPAIDFNINHFIGVSNFWHGTHEIFEMGHKDRSYDFATYQERVKHFCSDDWSTISERISQEVWGDHVGSEEAADACFKASWIINMLHDGIGVPRVGIESPNLGGERNGTKEVIESAADKGYLLPFQAVNKIDDTEVEWTLGKMILYAASQVPPADPRMLDVGFGSNDPDAPHILPADFQRGGSEPDVFKPTFNMADYGSDDADVDDDNSANTNVISDATNWRSTLLNKATISGRAPGYILFALILVLFAILLCGRDRRSAILHKVRHPFGGPRRGQVHLSNATAPGSLRQRRGKLPFGLDFIRSKDTASQRYERLLEQGDMPDPREFELARMASSEEDDDGSSSSSSSSRASGASHTSGRRKDGPAATPRRVAGSPYTGPGAAVF